jgi:hypothetical protein
MTHHPALALSFEFEDLCTLPGNWSDRLQIISSPAIPGCLNVSQLCNVREFRMRIREVEMRLDPPSTAAAAELATEIFKQKASDSCAS